MEQHYNTVHGYSNPTLINGFEDVMAHIRKLEEENKKLKEEKEMYRLRLCRRNEELVKALSPWKKEMQDHKRILEAIEELKQKYENATKRENNLMSSIESDVIVFEFIDHIGAIQCNKEDIDNYTENQSARETLYSLADIELPEEDEE